MALNPTGISKRWDNPWEVSLGLGRGSSLEFILPKMSAFQRFTCSVLGKHKIFHTGEEGQSTPHPHSLKVRFMAQPAPRAELHTGHPSVRWEMFDPSFHPSYPEQLQQQRVTMSPHTTGFLAVWETLQPSKPESRLFFPPFR